MAELTQRERLQPSLLDRLTDDDPKAQRESFDRRVLSLQQLRASVLRDLGWLLNARNLESVHDLAEVPQVAQSVVNYGIPDLTGRAASSVDLGTIERLLAQAICTFEPRILRRSLKVRLVRDQQQMDHNAMVFDIEGEMWAQPVPLRIYLRTELDLDSGGAEVTESQQREMA